MAVARFRPSCAVCRRPPSTAATCPLCARSTTTAHSAGRPSAASGGNSVSSAVRASSVLCSCGSDINSGTGLGALLAADKRYLVMAPRESAVRRFEMVRSIFRMMELDFDRIILNRFGSRSIFSPSYLGSRVGMDKNRILTVRESRYGDLCEVDEKSLLGYRDGAFKRDMASLKAMIEADCGSEEARHG